MPELLPRGIANRVTIALAASPVTILEGGRATGKSSLGEMLVDSGAIASIVDLSEPANLIAARNSASTFIDRLPTPCMIDEAQLVPEISLAVKRRVDRERRHGMFVLTGSSRLGRTGLGGSDPLAGRSLRLRLWPMTQGELAGRPRDLVSELFMSESFAERVNARSTAISHDDLLVRIKRGGLPGLAIGDMADIVRPQYLAEYLEAVVAHEHERRHDRAELIRLARYLCASTARLLNVATVANELQTTRETVAARISTLESLFLVHSLAGHRPNEHKVLTAHPKLHATDVGMAAWAARASTDVPAHVYGALVETFVVNELAAQASWNTEGIELRHWRDTRRKLEVDAVLLHADGSSIAIEVKAGVDIRPDDLAGLRAYLASDPAASRGVVFYSGAHTLSLDDRIDAIPISALWSRAVK